jgi:hypothetical protein
MSVYHELSQTMFDRDTEKYLGLLHEDFSVIFHKSGKKYSKMNGRLWLQA